MYNKKLWSPAAMVIALSAAFGTAQAKSLEQVGAPVAPIAALGNYGVDVAAKAGLKSLIPSGWNLFVYKNTNLPSTLSWNVQDTWVTALDRFAETNDLAVRVDWNKQAIYISTLEVAMQQKAKLAEGDAAAKTPLPAYAVDTSPAKATVATATPVAAAAPKTPAQADLAKDTAPVTPTRVDSELLARALAKTAAPTSTASAQAKPAQTAVVTTQPVRAEAASPVVTPPAVVPVASVVPIHLSPVPPAPVPFIPEATPSASPYAPATAFAPLTAPQSMQRSASASDAFAHGNLEDIVRTTATKHGYQVSWETISLPLDGPVTFLGADPAEDMRLLQKSLGMRQSPIAVEVYRGSNLIRITANNQNRDPLAVYDSSYTGLIGYGAKVAASPTPTLGATASAPAQATVSPPKPLPAVLPAVAKASTPAPAAPKAKAGETSAPVVTAPTSAPAPVPTAALKLHIDKGESLSKALAKFLETQNWELRWRVPTDMEAEFLVDLSGDSVKAVLNSILPKLGLDTDIYPSNHLVVVLPKDNIVD